MVRESMKVGTPLTNDMPPHVGQTPMKYSARAQENRREIVALKAAALLSGCDKIVEHSCRAPEGEGFVADVRLKKVISISSPACTAGRRIFFEQCTGWRGEKGASGCERIWR